MGNEPKRKPFESKKKFEARAKAEEKLKGYVHQDLKRARSTRHTYDVTCGHCKGGGMIGGGKVCRNCGGSGKITRG